MWNGWEKVKEERKRERERRWWRRRGKRREGSWEKVMEPEGAIGGVVEDNVLAPIDETESEVEEVRKREQVERSA
jgi:hypothetical protein